MNTILCYNNRSFSEFFVIWKLADKRLDDPSFSFVAIISMIYMQASDSHFIENASHYFNITEASSVLADVPSHFPE